MSEKPIPSARPPRMQRRNSQAIIDVHGRIGRRLSGIIDSKHAVIDGNMLGEHGMRIRQFAMHNDIIIGIRDLSSFAGSQLATRIQYSSPASGELTSRSKSSSFSSDDSGSYESRDSHWLEGAGKGLHLKAKSSIYPEIGGLIPALNILSKKPAETSYERARIDGTFEEILREPDSPYATITPRKSVGEHNYDICFYQASPESKEVTFVYKDDSSKYYSIPGRPESLITNKVILDKIQEVKVFADKETNSPLIPDYDIAILGSKASSIKKIHHEKFGIIRPEEESVISSLEKITNNMIRHGADTENPLGYKFEMTPETPYTLFTPDGQITSINNERSYIDFVNKQREEGYNLVLNPRTGVETVGGRYALPESLFRIDYKEIDSSISEIENPDQRRAAESIRDKEIEAKQIFATLPSAYHAALVNEARSAGRLEPTLDQAKREIEERKATLRDAYLSEMESYKKEYHIPSPTEKAINERSKVASIRSALEGADVRAKTPPPPPPSRDRSFSPSH